MKSMADNNMRMEKLLSISCALNYQINLIVLLPLCQLQILQNRVTYFFCKKASHNIISWASLQPFEIQDNYRLSKIPSNLLLLLFPVQVLDLVLVRFLLLSLLFIFGKQTFHQKACIHFIYPIIRWCLPRAGQRVLRETVRPSSMSKLFNRSGVAWAVLQTPLSLIN